MNSAENQEFYTIFLWELETLLWSQISQWWITWEFITSGCVHSVRQSPDLLDLILSIGKWC
jgi:hypothetical protein